MGDELRPGATIGGRYRLDRAIGEGGHGLVYAATDTNIGRSVAVKVMHAALSGKADIETRFEREAMLARSLSHPNTVRLLDFGRDEGGAFFIVYELLMGQGLDAALQAGAMATERVARVGAQVLKSLMEAHASGAVHRDIKPSNIFLCDFSGETDFVKVLDFGIAKVAASYEDLTETGFAIGTPSYMAPERVNGEEITAATDLYSLGLVLAEALTGQVVVQGECGTDIAAAQADPAPVPLPPAVLQSPLGPVIHRAVQKPLERRYASANEMLADLDAIGLGGPTPTIGAAYPTLSSAPTGAVSLTEPGAAPPWPPPAPFVSPPFVAPQPYTKRSASGGCWVGVFALAAIVLIVGAGAAVLLIGADAGGEPDDASSSSPPKKRDKKTSKKSPDPATRDPVAPPPAKSPEDPAPTPTPQAPPSPAPPTPVTPKPTPPPPSATATSSASTPKPTFLCGCSPEDVLCQLRCAQRGGK